MPRTSRRRPLIALVALTLVVLMLDAAGGGQAVGFLRAAGGVAFGPLERLLAPGGASVAEAAAVQDAAERAKQSRDALEKRAVQRLRAGPELAGSSLVPARVVAVGRQGPAGPERVTIDAGSRDGVRVDLCVVNADGLVGRVVAVSPWTADVALLGGAAVVVGVRVGSAGTLGSVASGARGPHRRVAGQLDLALVQRGTVRPGDAVTTLGSAGGSPFPPGLRVGTVTAVDPAPGDLAPGAAVRPAVDATALDVVGVLTTPPRSTPRPAVTVGG